MYFTTSLLDSQYQHRYKKEKKKDNIENKNIINDNISLPTLYKIDYAPLDTYKGALEQSSTTLNYD